MISISNPSSPTYITVTVLEAFSADLVETIPTQMTPKASELQFIVWSEVDPTTLDRISSPRESGTFFGNVEGVRFFFFAHIHIDFTRGTMMICISQI